MFQKFDHTRIDVKRIGKILRKYRTAVTVLILLSLSLVRTASAVREPAFTNTAEVHCQNAVRKGARALFAAQLKAWAVCFAAERRGEEPCDGVGAALAEAKFHRLLANNCEPLGDGFESALGLGPSIADAGEWIASGTATAASDIMQTLLAANAPAKAAARTAGVRSRCLDAIAKGAVLAVRGELRVDGRCLHIDDDQQVKDSTALPACDHQRRQNIRSNREIKAVALIERRCGEAEVLAASQGAVADAGSAVRLATDKSRGQLCDWYSQARNWPICFDQVERVELTRISEIGSLGWPGGFHGISSNDALPFEMELRDCITTGDQRSCGLFQTNNGDLFTLLHSVFGGAPSCALYRGLGDRTGTIRFNSNFEILALDLDEPYEIEVFLGSDFASPCPSCTGENVGDQGTCIGGPRHGLECVSMRSQDGFPHASLDCPPPDNLRVDTLRVTAGSSVFSSDGQHYAATETCTATEAETCHCPNQAAPNACATGVCPPKDGFCFNDGGQPVLCLPSPYTLEGGNPVDDEITIAQATCVEGISPPIEILVGVPGPMATSQRIRVRPIP